MDEEPASFATSVCFALSAFVSLQTDHALRADLGVVHHPGGQIEPVARVQLKRLIQLRQTERDRAAHHIDDFIVRV